MKILILNFIIACFFTPVFAQQSVKADNALLLEYYQNQHFSEAVDYLKKTFPEPISDLKTLSSLAYASQMAGRLLEADEYYQRIYLADTSNITTLFNLGGINARRGNNVKAISYFKKILLKDSTNFNVYKQIANISQSNGNIDNAIMYLQKANKLNPVDPDVAYDISTFYLNLKQYTKADTIILIAIKADSANLLLMFAKAQIDFRLDRYPETVAMCNSLIAAGNQAGTVITMLGTSYFNLKNYNSCISTFEVLEQGKTANESSYYYTAMSFKALGKPQMAVNYLNKAIKEAISANVNAYYDEIAECYDKMHQSKAAAGAYQKSLLYGIKPLTYYALALLYDAELKKKSFACHYYKKYIASHPPENQKSYIAYAKNRIMRLKS